MTLESLINKLTHYFSWLYYRRWERWELLTIVITALALLFWALRAYRKTKAEQKREHDHSSIIGKKLAGDGRR